MSYTTITLWLLGYADQALNRICEVLTLAHRLSHAYSLAMAIAYVTFARCYLREIDRTKESAEELIDYSTENRFPILSGVGKVMRFWACGMEKKEKKIIDKMHQAIEELNSIRFFNIRTFFLFLLAEVCIAVEQIEEGLKTLEEAQAWMVKIGERFWEAEIYRLKGEMLSSQSVENQKEAESCFHQAIEVAQHQRAKSLELRAAMSLSRVWQSQGNKEEAKHLLSEIYGWFTEGFDTSDLKDAKALLEELS